MSDYRTPLNVYVVWRPAADTTGVDKGLELARLIYSTFARDIEHPLESGLGIPVFFRYAPGDGARTPLPIYLEKAERNAVIVLASGGMVTDADWGTYLTDLRERVKATAGNHRIFPISLSSGALNLKLGQTNAIRYHEFPPETAQTEMILWLTLALCRFMREPLSGQPGEESSPEPSRLFISHAKQDGLPIAQEFQKVIEQTPAASFFDSIDIASGYDFGSEIESKIRDSTLLVLQSDRYSSRPWCRREVLMAKKLGRPIMIVNAIDEDEKRSFPYMGNVPVIRFTGKNHQRIVGLALREHLRFLYNESRIDALQRAGRIPEDALVLKRPPEILDFQNIKEASHKAGHKKLVIYPDPPLGAEEGLLLSAFDGDVAFATMTMPQDQAPLSDKTIGLSISETSDLRELGFDTMHLRDALIEFTRYLLSRDATVAYGGDLRRDGFTQLLFSLVHAHNSSGAAETYEPIRNYIAWPLHLNVNEDTAAELINVAQLTRVPLPEDVVQELGIATDTFLRPDTTVNRYVWARSLSAMRDRMNADLHARVLMGGKSTGYTGKYPGLLEEAYLALRASKPLYLLGGFGGCTRGVIEMVEGGKAETLTLDYQCKDEAYKQLVEEYNTRAAQKPELEPIDYDRIRNAFREAGFAGLHNGLDADENRRLFHAKDPDEIIHLVLKGLCSLVG